MSYSDDPYNVTDVEIPQAYRDEPSDEVILGEHDIVTTQSRHSSGGSLSSRVTTLLVVCALAALAFGRWQYYGHGVGNSSDSNAVSGLEDRPPPGSKGLFPKKVGVRGHNGSNDEEGDGSGSSTLNDERGDDGAHDETVVENKNKAAAPRPNDEKVKASVSTTTTTSEAKEIVAPEKSATNKSVVPPVAANNQPPSKPEPTVDDDCQDDNTFIMPNLKTCQTYIARVGRPILHDRRCGQGSGVLDQNGNELLLKNFCRSSCKNCDAHASPIQKKENEYVEELEELEEEEEEEFGVVVDDLLDDEEEEEEESSIVGTSADGEGEVEEEDIGLWEDLAEEENESQEESNTFEEKAAITSNGDVGCEDDDTQQFSNGKTCATYVANVGRPVLNERRCNSSSGIKDEKNGGELPTKHFCKNSCEYCDEVALSKEEVASNKGATNEHAEEMDNSAEQAGVVDEASEAESNRISEDEHTEELDTTEKEDASVVGEAGKAEDTHNGKHEDAGKPDNTKKDETGVPDGASGAEDDQNGKQEDAEDPDKTKKDEDSAADETSGAKGKQNGKHEHAEELDTSEENEAVVVGEASKGEDNHNSESEHAEDPDNEGERLPDYFVPLTELERDALKERLRGILKATKNALAMTNALKAFPEESKDAMAVEWQRTLVLSGSTPKQFMHLQLNQTGSESVDGVISCAVDRQQQVQKALQGKPIGVREISEGDNLGICMNELASRLGATLMDGKFYRNDEEGNPLTDLWFDPADEKLGIPDEAQNACGTLEANVMNYRTSLNAVRTFGWLDVDSIAMFANPVERLHRTYQHTAKECYGCQNLSDILRQIKSGKFGKKNGAPQSTTYHPRDSCAVQMIGHQATNLLYSPALYDVANDVSFPHEREIVDEAVRSLREGITWIGVSDQMEDSVSGFKEIFPWLADNLNDLVEPLEHELVKGGSRLKYADFALPVGWIDKYDCAFEPEDVDFYICGSKEVDEDALKLIEELNMRDLAVYKAALERFDLQNEVIREYREALHLDQ